MRTFHSPTNLYLNQRGSRESHKPLHLSNEPKIHGLCHSVHSPLMLSDVICQKTIPKRCNWCDTYPNAENWLVPTLNAVIGARYPNAVIWLVRDTYPKRCDWCKISKCCVRDTYPNAAIWSVWDTYPNAEIWLVRDTYPNAAIWLVRATYY